MTTLRRIFLWIHFVAATLVVLGVVVQVYLAAGQLFGADSLDLHEDFGWIAVHNLELLVLVAAVVAWRPRADIVWSFLLALVGTVQILLSGADEWVGAIHGGGALVVFVIAAIVAHRSARALGLRRSGAGESAGTPPPPR